MFTLIRSQKSTFVLISLRSADHCFETLAPLPIHTYCFALIIVDGMVMLNHAYSRHRRYGFGGAHVTIPTYCPRVEEDEEEEEDEIGGPTTTDTALPSALMGHSPPRSPFFFSYFLIHYQSLLHLVPSRATSYIYFIEALEVVIPIYGGLHSDEGRYLPQT
ncbi:hypothetical protein Cgig2_004382 [Carnegiea gigantea]|uniref:Uncharacterized protein n=1 Tax=Carnegiea gigantea TaxID=171969 RepID=A0A9Q1QCA9_9CARY|nr:hypothetical protein Cgig2_004382 [Carnegiea gigantea]